MAPFPAPLDTAVEIITPENIAFRYRLAGPFRRFPAFVVDVLIRWSLVMILAVIASLLGILVGGMSIAVILIGYFVIEWFYGGLFETFFNGQTPGKWAFGIRVLTVDGQPINGLQAVMRNILRFTDMMPLVSLQVLGGPPAYVLPTFGLALLTMALSRRFQRLGDLVCGTMVVVEQRSRLAGIARLEDPRIRELAALLPPDFRASRSMSHALATYVDRRRLFHVARREEVARHLAEPLLEKFGLPRDTSYDLLLCALYHQTFVTDRVAEEDERVGSPFAAAGDPFAAPVAGNRLASQPPEGASR